MDSKTSLRLYQNARTFYFKRKYVLTKTLWCFVSNVKAFFLKHKNDFISLFCLTESFCF